MRSVAVVGAGPAGLAAAKAALELGLRPVVFERERTIGGLWRPVTGAAWPAMATNLSRYTCAFSDHPWEDGSPDFPRQPEMHGYLRAYADAFALGRHVRLGVAVTGLERAGGRWRVRWREVGTGSHGVEGFDAVVVASGFFSRPFVPRLPGTAAFRGVSLHSSEYRGAGRLVDRRVTVIGTAFSGAEIAADLASAGARVTAVVGRPMWLLPRLAPGGVPLDLLLYRRSPARAPEPPGERNRRRNRLFDSLGGNPGRLDARLRLDPESEAAHHALIARRLDDHVAAGRLSLRPGRARRLDRRALVLDNGVDVPSDAVIWCTGYRLELPFLGRRELDLMGFDAADHLQPLLLHRCTFHPDLPDLAFAGVYRGPFFAVIELQARWACAVLGGEREAPGREAMLAGLRVEHDIRAARPRPQFPHGDYVDLADGLAREIDVLPDLEGPVVPAHYRLRGPFSRPALALREIERANRRAGR